MIEIAYQYHTTVVIDEDTNMVHCKGEFDLEEAVVRWRARYSSPDCRNCDADDETQLSDICMEMEPECDPGDWLEAAPYLFTWAKKHDHLILECSTL